MKIKQIENWAGMQMGEPTLLGTSWVAIQDGRIVWEADTEEEMAAWGVEQCRLKTASAQRTRGFFGKPLTQEQQHNARRKAEHWATAWATAWEARVAL